MPSFSIHSQTSPLTAQTIETGLGVSTDEGFTFYVSVNGNDSNNGSLLSPFRTIQFATSKIEPDQK